MPYYPMDKKNLPINDVLYLCDRKRCKRCSYPTCRHTTDINHAVNDFKKENFKEIIENLNGEPVKKYFVEGDPDDKL